MGEQQGAAEEADERKDEGGGRRDGGAGLYPALVEGEGDDQQHRQTVLQRLGDQEAAPEGDRSERPVLGVGQQEEEDGEGEKGERPVARPAPAGAGGDGEQAGKQHHQPGDVVIELRQRQLARRAGLGELAGDVRQVGAQVVLARAFGGSL